MGCADVAERRWLELVADLLAEPLVEMPVERISVELVRTFAGAGCSFSSWQDGYLAGAIYPLTEAFSGHRREMEEWAVAAAVRWHPLLVHYRGSGRAGLLQVADVPDRFVHRRVRDAWFATWRPWGCADQLALPLSPDGARAFVLARDRRFSDRELDLAHRIWRLLAGVDRQAQALGRTASPAPQVIPDLRLTPRELAVLGLLVEGLTAVAIGRRLAVAERTVHKHLQHAYAKLGANDRLSAVLRARDLGVLPVRSSDCAVVRIPSLMLRS